jgi:predicted ATPase
VAAAAVIGRSFSFRLLTAISRIDVNELFTVVEKAQRMGLIVPSSEGPERPFTFTHELTRQTFLAGISVPRRQYLHSVVADAIEMMLMDRAALGDRQKAQTLLNEALETYTFIGIPGTSRSPKLFSVSG